MLFRSVAAVAGLRLRLAVTRIENEHIRDTEHRLIDPALTDTP